MSVPAWKTQLQKASFRGVPFGVSDIETVIGRRNVLHEYPLRDEPYAEDLGKKAREYTVNAFVIGDDYFQNRDALIAAIENQDTPGILMHPTLGIKSVIPTQCRHIFKNTEGGIEYFVITFVEAGQNKYPTSVTNTQANASTIVTESKTAIKNNFSDNFKVNDLPDIVASRAASVLNGESSSLSGTFIHDDASLTGLLSNVVAKRPISSSAQSEFTQFQSNIKYLRTNAGALVADSDALTDHVNDLLNGVRLVYKDDPRSAIKALIQLYKTFGSTLSDIPVSNPMSTLQTQMILNQRLLVDLVQLMALFEIILAVSLVTFDSRQDALAMSDEVTALINPKLFYIGDNGDDESYNALMAAKVAMVNDISARADTLKDIVYVQIKSSLPALVLAYMKYGDASQSDDIVSRNRIRNPGFVPALTNIEILQ